MDYVRKAEELERAASRIVFAEHRAELLEIAAHWRALAHEVERLAQTRNPDA